LAKEMVAAVAVKPAVGMGEGRVDRRCFVTPYLRVYMIYKRCVYVLAGKVEAGCPLLM